MSSYYILEYRNSQKYQQFVIFPRDVQHRHMREVIGQGDINVRSAGFVRIKGDGTLECYGESIGLRTKPMPDDTEKINAYFYQQS